MNITAPCVIERMPADEYHAEEGLSNSGLTILARSPAHYYALKLDPNRPPEEDKAGQLEGTLAHCAILEPEQFDKRYRVAPNMHRGTKVWKELDASATADGLVLIQLSQYDTAMRQAESVRRIREVRDLLDSGRPELSAFARDPRTGVIKKCRPDWTHEFDGGAILMDVKTYSDASPHEFKRQIARKGYYRQDAHYRDTYELAAQTTVHGFIFLAVETSWPYQPSAVMLTEEDVEIGRQENEMLTETYAQCMERNRWPGYGDEISLVTLPKYITNRMEEV